MEYKLGSLLCDYFLVVVRIAFRSVSTNGTCNQSEWGCVPGSEHGAAKQSVCTANKGAQRPINAMQEQGKATNAVLRKKPPGFMLPRNGRVLRLGFRHSSGPSLAGARSNGHQEVEEAKNTTADHVFIPL